MSEPIIIKGKLGDGKSAYAWRRLLELLDGTLVITNIKRPHGEPGK